MSLKLFLIKYLYGNIFAQASYLTILASSAISTFFLIGGIVVVAGLCYGAYRMLQENNASIRFIPQFMLIAALLLASLVIPNTLVICLLAYYTAPTSAIIGLTIGTVGIAALFVMQYSKPVEAEKTSLLQEPVEAENISLLQVNRTPQPSTEELLAVLQESLAAQRQSKTSNRGNSSFLDDLSFLTEPTTCDKN